MKEYILHIQKPKDKPNEMSNPSIPLTPFHDLAKAVNGQLIGDIEGTLSSLYEPSRGKGQYGDWVMQNGVITDGGLEQRITFGAEELVQPDSMKGKRIRISSGLYKNALKGLKMSEKTKDGKTYRSLEVKFPAKVEVVGATTGQPIQQQVPQAAFAGGAPQNSRPAKPPEPTPSDDSAEVRVANWFRVFGLVCATTGHDPDEVMHNFSPSDLKEITTGTVASFKGPYATYQAPFFAGSQAQIAQSTERINQQFEQAAEVTKRLQDDTLPADMPTGEGGWPVEQRPDWRNFTWEKNNQTIRLGDKSPKEIAEMVAFFQKSPPTGDVGKSLFANLKVAVAELESGNGPYREGEDDGLPG
jgi:hypothetical protein